MMRKLSTWLLGLLVATMVSACCGSVACECNDSFADAVYFRFNLADSLGTAGFRAEDVDTVTLVRLGYVDELILPRPVPVDDTARIIRSRALVSEPILLNNNAPFTAGGGRKLDAYQYQLYVVRRFKRPGDTTMTLERVFFTLDQIQLAGRFVGDGCCTCYENNGKQLRVSRGKEGSQAGTIVNLKPLGGEELQAVVLSR